MPAASIKEVAHLAGVSIGTVSNVLNHPQVVAPATRQRVLDAIESLGYVRNDSARQLRVGRSRLIAMVVLDVTNPYFTDVVRGAEAAADEHDLVVMVCDSSSSTARERRQLDLLEEQRVRGILITPVSGEEDSRVASLVRRGTPVVVVDGRIGPGVCCSVAVDDVLGGRLAAEHLLERGHRRLAYIGGPLEVRAVAERLRGFTAALRSHPDPAPSPLLLTMQALTVGEGRAAGRRVADMPESQRPTGVFCANDLLALGVLQEMIHQGMDVPGEVAIVGYDDIDFAEAAAVPLSSVRQPRHRLGWTAIQLLVEDAQEDTCHRHRQVVFEPRLVVRRSSEISRRSVLPPA